MKSDKTLFVENLHWQKKKKTYHVKEGPMPRLEWVSR